jgi:hypothetical protein
MGDTHVLEKLKMGGPLVEGVVGCELIMLTYIELFGGEKEGKDKREEQKVVDGENIGEVPADKGGTGGEPP